MLHQEIERDQQGAEGQYRRSVSRLLSTIGPDRGRLVGSGFHKVLGALLDWPDWIFSGSTIEPSATLPRKIKLADDLILIANLADRVGPAFILSSLATRPSHASSPAMYGFLMSAPTLRHAIQFAVDVLHSQNPHLSFAITETDAGNVELRSTLPTGGNFAHFYAFSHLAVFAGLASLLGVHREGADTVELHGGDKSWHDSLQPLSSAVTFVASDETKLVISSTWADRKNLYYDQRIWRTAQDQLETLREAYHESDLLIQIDAEVEHVLFQERRAPSLAEVARIVGLSQRTLTRRFAFAGVTFRQRVDVARRKQAEIMLQDGDRTIASIARSLGFSHSSSFARAFAAWTGSSPREWRQRKLRRQGDGS